MEEKNKEVGNYVPESDYNDETDGIQSVPRWYRWSLVCTKKQRKSMRHKNHTQKRGESNRLSFSTR